MLPLNVLFDPGISPGAFELEYDPDPLPEFAGRYRYCHSDAPGRTVRPLFDSSSRRKFPYKNRNRNSALVQTVKKSARPSDNSSDSFAYAEPRQHGALRLT